MKEYRGRGRDRGREGEIKREIGHAQEEKRKGEKRRETGSSN